MSYVYIQTERAGRDGNDLFTVGFYMPKIDADPPEFVPESDHPTKDEAASRVHYLNGGCA